MKRLVAATFAIAVAAVGAEPDALVPVRPGGVNGQAFWNGHADWFLYPPAFDFKAVPGAAKYRFTVLDDQHIAKTFEADAPTASLAPVWGEIPPGLTSVRCEGIDAQGRVCGLAGERLRFWRQAPFREGAYPPAKRGYAEAAALVYDYLYARPSTRHLAETGEMDFTYSRNAYPAKMGSAVVSSMVQYAKRRPERAEAALEIARKQGDWLLRHSQPKDAPLAYFPPTYAGDKLTAKRYAGECMLMYPVTAANSYLALFEATKEAKWRDAALNIGETFLRLQGRDGTWWLKMREKDGEPISRNRCFPMHQITFFEKLYALTNDRKWRDAADRAFVYVENGPLKTWNWEGQFEDVEPTERFVNLTKHDACSTAMYLLERFPGDAARIAQARELLRFSEDQFVCWELPCRVDGKGPRYTGKEKLWVQNDYLDWVVPGVTEQYRCYHPIDSSAAKLILTYLAMWRATGNATDLAKARALGDSIVNLQDPDGRIPTHWNKKHFPDRDYDWVNCMLGSAHALEMLAEATECGSGRPELEKGKSQSPTPTRNSNSSTLNPQPSTGAERRTKIIGHGWDMLASTPAEIIANADAFDRSGMDGVTVVLGGKRNDGKDKGVYNMRSIPLAAPWTREMLEVHMPALRQFRDHRGLRESLVMCWWAPKKRIAWADDAAWARFAESMGVLSAFTKEAGLKGLIIDNEDYPRSKQWLWSVERDGMDYAATCALARRRGAQMGQAMFTAFPEMRMVMFFLLSAERSYFTAKDPAAHKAVLGDLWPAFVDGMLDVMPATARLVDGDEHSYHCDAAKHDYYKHEWNMREICPLLLSEENRPRYQERLSVAFAIYLDMYTSTNPASCWYFGPGADGTRLSRFTANVVQSARVADEYVWLYGEKGTLIDWRRDIPCAAVAKSKRFLPALEAGTSTWDSKLPGFTDTIRFATDPIGLAREALARDKGNLADWSKWKFWQHERKSHGTKSKDTKDTDGNAFSLVAKGVASGCFIHNVKDVKPGQMFAVEASMKGRGTVSVTWSEKGKLTNDDPRYPLEFGEPDARGWSRGVVAVCVPPGMDMLVVHMSANGQKPDEEVRFGSLRVVKVCGSAGR